MTRRVLMRVFLAALLHQSGKGDLAYLVLPRKWKIPSRDQLAIHLRRNYSLILERSMPSLLTMMLDRTYPATVIGERVNIKLPVQYR